MTAPRIAATYSGNAATLRALAVHLADDPALTVSVITCQGGTAEFEVLRTGPSHPRPPGH